MPLYQISSTLKSLSTKLNSEYRAPGEADAIARQILTKVTQLSTIQLLLNPEQKITEADWKQAHQLVAEHVEQKKPLAYILGEQPFLELTLTMRPPILIPRPETEWWCNELIKQLQELPQELRKNLTILDLCSGSGCIALSLAKALPDAKIIGIDINPAAIDLAQENAKKHDISNAHFIQSDLFAEVESQTFDLIVANPPYIDVADYKSLPESVHAWEDKHALWAAQNGTALIRQIILHAPQQLSNKLYGHIPRLWIEIGYNQKTLANELSTEQLPLVPRRDLYGVTRLLQEKIQHIHQ